MPDVIVVGAGPVGTLIAAELVRRDVEVALLERRAAPGERTRAIGIHSPVLAALERSGVTERLLASAVRVYRGEARAENRTLGVVRFDRLRRRFPFVAALPQTATEAALGTDAPSVRGGTEVGAVTRVGSGIRVSLRDGDVLEAPIVVVAAGGRSRGLVYRPGAVRALPYRDRYLMADVASTRDADLAVINVDAAGVLESFPLPGGRRRFVAWDAAPDAPGAADRLRAVLRRCDEHDAADEVLVASAFEVRRAVAPALRCGGLFVIGDTAHEISPIGGQGMNLGLLDAATLAPLIAEWVRTGVEPSAGLDRWERRRLASARTAAALATLNTSLGRPLGPAAHTARRTALRVALRPPGGRLLAHAYAMGFDRDA